MALSTKLPQWQSDLLDLTRLNPLLYYKPTGRGAGVQILEPSAHDLYAKLLRTANYSPSFDWIDRIDDEEERDALAKRLTRLRARTSEDMRDRGLQTLYLAFGLLDWRERADSQERVLTPLVLLPVTLGRKGPYGSFTLSRASDDDPEVNPVLREKMRNDFHVMLPTYEMALERVLVELEEESADDEEMERVTKRQIRLSDVIQCLFSALPPEMDPHIREEAHLGRFSFQKLVMYQDLRKHEPEIQAHTLLRSLGGDRVTVPQPARLIAAAEIDAVVSPRETLEVLDADSSQQEAILAAKAGANFVLQGPPGTGKSQTIANIIAECLGAGEKVLFVSEKMAALEVVWNRLRDAKLDDFLLNLHDPRQKREGFLRDLSATLHNPSDRFDSSRDWEATSARLAQERNELNAYVRELHAPRFALQISAFDAYGKLAALHDTPRLEFALSEVPQTNDHRRAYLLRLLDDLKEHLDILDRLNDHPWRDTLLEQYSIAREGDIQAHLTQMASQLLVCARDGAQLCAIVEPMAATTSSGSESGRAPSLEQLGHAGVIAQHALTAPFPPLRSWLNVEHTIELLDVAVLAQGRCNAYHDDTRVLDKIYRRAVCQEDLDALHADLTSSCADAVAALAHPSGVSPHDVALTARARIAPLLVESAQALTELLEQSGSLASDLGLPAPVTVQDAVRICDVARHTLLTPRPPRHWLEPNMFPGISVFATDAYECARLARSQRERLSAIYRDDLFALDIASVEERFRTRYHSIFRVFNGQYRADTNGLRACTRTDGPPMKRTHAELAADVGIARQVVAAEGWLRERRADLAGALGRLYDVQTPDWEGIAAAVRWTLVFNQLFALASPTGEVPEPLCHLVTIGGSSLDALRTHVTSLSAALERWDRLASQLRGIVRSDRLPGGVLVQLSSSIESLRQSLIDMKLGLEPLWRAETVLHTYRLEANAPNSSTPWPELVQHVELLRRVVSAERWLSGHSAEYGDLFGERFIGFETDWNDLVEGLRWSQTLAGFYPGGQVPATVVECVAEDADPAAWDELERLADSVSDAVEATGREMAYIATVLPESALVAPGYSFDKTPVHEIADRVQTLLATLPDLERLMAGRLHVQECRDAGLGSLLDAALARKPFPRDITRMFEQQFYALWLDAARAESRELSRFSGEKHEATIARYRLLEQERIELSKWRLRARLFSQRSVSLQAADAHRDSPRGQALARLRKIAGQKRPRGSIRQIVRSIGPILLDLKPCWMMSPLSVSQFVEESGPIFDVVVFDEASQVRPEDAICAILRGRRLIVVGDSKQLPPTQFFTKEHRDEDEEDSDDTVEQQLEDGRRESILEECRATGMPDRALRWHYRSRHESLIAFSNHHFYDDKLITFPNPGDTHADGVRFEYVADGLYDFGASRTNQPEAERVVDLVLEHMRRRPHLSLGVVALSAAQQEAISSALEWRRKRDPETNAFAELLDEDRSDGLFIKNLESVQGDERDVIILSIGYGRANDGRIRYNFGPVNRAGGARRLNVAVTRAREQTILVSSIRASDLPDSLGSEGARILRAYLEYAERGVAALRDIQHSSDDLVFDSPFEEAVFDALRRKGLTLATQVGCSGYRIDLAVRDPEDLDRFVLGIECDGRTYHSSKTARDRDRLRQNHLEHMGWTIHRIWSSEWRRDPDGQVNKIMNRISALRDERALRSFSLEPATVHVRHGPAPDNDAARTPPDSGANGHRNPVAPTDTSSRGTGTTTTPLSSRATSSGVQRAAEAAKEAAPQKSSTTSAHTRGYAPLVNDPGLLHSVASWAGGEFVCEGCAHFTLLRPGRFTCSKLQRTQAQADSGSTPCCAWWKVQ